MKTLSDSQERPTAGSGAELEVRSLLAKVENAFAGKPFKPHPLFVNGHAQTLAGYAWPRRSLLRTHLQHDEERLFEVEPGVRVLAHCRWQSNRKERPTVVLWHGIEGSSASIYMLGTAQKAFRAGFNVVRLNLRNCGGTEHLTPTLYHGGLTEDLRVVVGVPDRTRRARLGRRPQPVRRHDRSPRALPRVRSRASTTTKAVTTYARTAPYPKSVCSNVVLNV